MMPGRGEDGFRQLRRLGVTMNKGRTSAAALVCAAAVLAATATPASADTGFHYLALKAPGGGVSSVYVTGRGWTTWATDSESGSVGSPQNPVGLDACYQYNRTRPPRDWVRGGDGVQIYVNQAPGEQGIGSGFQRSDPRWVDSTSLIVVPMGSRDCTVFAQAKKSVRVPSDSNTYFWLSL